MDLSTHVKQNVNQTRVKKKIFRKVGNEKRVFIPENAQQQTFIKKKVKQTDQQWQEYVHEYCLGNDVLGKSRPGGLQPGARLPVKPGQH